MAASSKAEILKHLRSTQLEPVELPELDEPWTTYQDRAEQFAEVLQAVGGRAVRAGNLDEVNRELDQLPAYAQATKVCSLVDGIRKANVQMADVADPHELEDVDFLVAPGQFGVAENAAVWVTDQGLRHRVLYFLAQHLALVLPVAELVDNMDQAYQRLSFAEPGFGLFLSGPSKTADIEQALVIGAHGARSLTVFLV
ncbi:MAG: LUD domain-containing protein [Candidatus Anammoximicrobium sp.]|nr:LUD domain-containing protein [Candidatus Anammoximicrobium sp.]